MAFNLRRKKYGNSECEYNGEMFDSKKEMSRYIFLLQQQQDGRIHDLQRQISFELIPNQYEDVVVTKRLKTKLSTKVVSRVLFKKVTYKCDFAYRKTGTDEYVVEDVKASKTMLPKEFLLKEKLLYYFKKIRIRRVFKVSEPI